jgi:hypothetical protein
MAHQTIRFDDGAAYERMMGVWSRLAGEIFLDWLAPLPGLKWIDVGCGNGAFTDLVVNKNAPAEIKRRSLGWPTGLRPHPARYRDGGFPQGRRDGAAVCG